MALLVEDAGLLGENITIGFIGRRSRSTGENITIGFIGGGSRTTRREHNDWFYWWRKQEYLENTRRLALLVEGAGLPGENITIDCIRGGSRATRREHHDLF